MWKQVLGGRTSDLYCHISLPVSISCFFSIIVKFNFSSPTKETTRKKLDLPAPSASYCNTSEVNSLWSPARTLDFAHARNAQGGAWSMEGGLVQAVVLMTQVG